MHTGHALTGLGLLATALVGGVEPAVAFCSAFTTHPCFSAVCSAFANRYCIPHPDYWIGQDLRLTIESASAGDGPAGGAPAQDSSGEHKLDTLHAMFDALRACWIPPAKEEARPGMQMSVRFAFKRSGEIIATPRVTYATSGISAETRGAYLQAIMASLGRCTPMHFSAGLAGAVVGRPIAVRFVDNRELP